MALRGETAPPLPQDGAVGARDDARVTGAASARRQLSAYLLVFVRAVPRARIAGGIALVLAGALTEGIGLALLVPIVAFFDGSAPRSAGMAQRLFAAVGLPLSLPVLVTIFIALVGLRAVVLRARELALVRLRLDFTDALRRRLYRAVAHADWQLLVRERVSDIAKVLTIDIDRIGAGTSFFLHLPANLTVALVQIAIALRLAPRLTLAAMAVAAVAFLLLRRSIGTAYGIAGEVAKANRSASTEIARLLDGLKLSKSHNLEDQHIAALDRIVAEQHRRTYAFAAGGTGTRMAIQIGVGVALGLYVLAAEQFAQLDTATLVVTVAIFSRLLPLIPDMQTAARSVLGMLPIFAEWRDLEARATAAAEPLASSPAGRLSLARDIRLVGVRFRYDKDRDVEALSDIDLAIPAGSITAIVGRSGAGKSTLADLVMGLITPDAGQVLIDGVPLDTVGLARWRRSIAYVPQENFLFHDTIRANLLWAAPEAREEDLDQALALAAADRFVARLPQGTRHHRRRARHADFRRRAPAPGRCPRADSAPDPPHPRRGDECARHRDRERNRRRHRPPAWSRDRDRDRAPPLDRPPRRPDRRGRGRTGGSNGPLGRVAAGR